MTGYYGTPIKHILKNAGWTSDTGEMERHAALDHAIKEHGIESVIKALETVARMWKFNNSHVFDACEEDIKWLNSDEYIIREEQYKREQEYKEWVKKKWTTGLEEMKKDYNNVKDIEVRDIDPNIKVTEWQHFINAFKEDNPYTIEDDSMRHEAKKQLDYWSKQPSEIKLSTIIGKDGVEMVLISAGEFQMGNNDYNNEKPVHTVYLDAFYIDKYEVTNTQYKKFMSATGHKAPKYWNDSRFNVPNHPVVGISWDDAVVYCQWVKKRLPTEAEWEKSARGRLVGKKYSSGNVITNANYDCLGGKDIWIYTSPVGSFAPNGYGLYDMIGNVWEWCNDWFDKNYYVNSPKENPKGPDSGERRVLRGSSWNFNAKYLRVSYRNLLNPSFANDYVGFRCAQDVPK